MKYIQVLIILLTAIIACSSCNNNNYERLCDENRYVQAYNVVYHYKKEADRTKKKSERAFTFVGLSSVESAEKRYEEVKCYVVLHECTHILDVQGIEGLPRIASIVVQYDAPSVYESLIKIAYTLGDDELVTHLKNMSINYSEFPIVSK